MIKLIKIKGVGRGVIPTMSDLNFFANNKKTFTRIYDLLQEVGH